MRGAATGDLHLGYRAYAARTPDGRNAREVDVERAWGRVVDEIVSRGVDLVTVAGDVFHHPRVGMHAVMAWRDGVRRIIKGGSTIVVIQGNHDAGRSADTLTPVVVPDDYPDCYVVTEPCRLRLNRAGQAVAVTCFPFYRDIEEQEFLLEPAADADLNILLMHAAVKTSADPDAIPWFYGSEGAIDVGREADRWDVIHVGDFHGFNRLHPDALAFYAGAPERTTSNVWQEGTDRGFVEWWIDPLPDRGMEHVVIPGVRPVVHDENQDIHDADELNTWLEGALRDPDLEDAVVRLTVHRFPRVEKDLVDWSQVRAMKRHALHFELDLRFEDFDPVGAASAAMGGLTLEQRARAFFDEDPEAVREEALLHLGIGSGSAEEAHEHPE